MAAPIATSSLLAEADRQRQQAEQPRPARPKASTPAVRVPLGRRARTARADGGHERQQPVRARGSGNRSSMAANRTRPTVTIAQNVVSAREARAAEAPRSARSCTASPSCRSSSRRRRTAGRTRRTARSAAEAPAAALRRRAGIAARECRGDLERQAQAEHQQDQRAARRRAAAAPTRTPRPRKTATSTGASAVPRPSRAFRYSTARSACRGEEPGREDVERRHRQPEADPQAGRGHQEHRVRQRPVADERAGSRRAATIATRSPTSPARNGRFMPGPPGQASRPAARPRSRRPPGAGTARRRPCSSGRSRCGLVRIELAAGNVTSATPWTRPAP